MSNTAEILGEKPMTRTRQWLIDGAVAAGTWLVLAVGVISLAAVEK